MTKEKWYFRKDGQGSLLEKVTDENCVCVCVCVCVYTCKGNPLFFNLRSND